MPTTHVRSSQAELLQTVADIVFKARKVIVVTGAGISTNSGIPDFRSENGLYSLIQAQFDAAAARQAKEPCIKPQDESDDERPSKRRRLDGRDDGDDPDMRDAPIELIGLIAPIEQPRRKTWRAGSWAPATLPIAHNDTPAEALSANGRPPDTTLADVRPPSSDAIPRISQLKTPTRASSPLSSPPPEESDTSTCSVYATPKSRVARLINSSPLSSPPPGLRSSPAFSEPDVGAMSRQSSSSGCSASSGSGTGTSTGCNSTPPSELSSDDNPTNAITSRPSAALAAKSLPNIRGRDLFDSSIWSDPLRTSVFYTFATTLRQKVREVSPTDSHYFIVHLRDRGKLVRCYTQNIDQIEEKAGLTTTLSQGPGSKGRFSRRSLAVDARRDTTAIESLASSQPQYQPQLENTDESTSLNQPPSLTQTSTSSTDSAEPDSSQTPGDTTKDPGDAKDGSKDGSDIGTSTEDPPLKRRIVSRGVECVFLHGSLQSLRCFLCGRMSEWDVEDREQETLSGRQPECPHCAGATLARQEKGKRALGVGKLRPDIVLYGEEHPNSDLISPIVTHDLNLVPDLLLILGTSLRVHGLKVMVREFARAVHEGGGPSRRGAGKVVFVNFTRPSESTWGDIIDYWVEWDCDAWVSDLKDRIPGLWGGEPDEAAGKKKRESLAVKADKKQESLAVKADDRKRFSIRSRGKKIIITSKPSAPTELDQADTSVLGSAAEDMTAASREGSVNLPEPEEGRSGVDAAAAAGKNPARRRTRPGEVSGNASPEASQPKKPKTRPQAVRDDKANAAYCMWKIQRNLARIRNPKTLTHPEAQNDDVVSAAALLPRMTPRTTSLGSPGFTASVFQPAQDILAAKVETGKQPLPPAMRALRVRSRRSEPLSKKIKRPSPLARESTHPAPERTSALSKKTTLGAEDSPSGPSDVPVVAFVAPVAPTRLAIPVPKVGSPVFTVMPSVVGTIPAPIRARKPRESAPVLVGLPAGLAMEHIPDKFLPASHLALKRKACRNRTNQAVAQQLQTSGPAKAQAQAQAQEQEQEQEQEEMVPRPQTPTRTPTGEDYNIFAAVKLNPRVRKPKLVDGEPVTLPSLRTRLRTSTPAPRFETPTNLDLAPIQIPDQMPLCSPQHVGQLSYPPPAPLEPPPSPDWIGSQHHWRPSSIMLQGLGVFGLGPANPLDGVMGVGEVSPRERQRQREHMIRMAMEVNAVEVLDSLKKMVR